MRCCRRREILLLALAPESIMQGHARTARVQMETETGDGSTLQA